MTEAGIIKSRMVEVILSVIGVLLFAGFIFLGAGLGLLFGIPYILIGLIVGVAVLILIASGSMAVSVEVTCSNCQSKQKVVRNIVSYQCPACGHRNKVRA